MNTIFIFNRTGKKIFIKTKRPLNQIFIKIQPLKQIKENGNSSRKYNCLAFTPCNSGPINETDKS